jgi:predicted metal-dependent HD superfamily phosphohydrolase
MNHFRSTLKEFFTLDLPQADTELVAACIGDVVTYYSEPHRHWHNGNHISQMLDSVFMNPSGGKSHQYLEVIFHDVVYDPKSSTNEEDSLDFMKTWLTKLYDNPQDFWPDRNWDAGILATKTHQSDNLDIQVVLDADLEILSKSWDKYWAYAQAIRAEYSHVPDVDFARGRADFMVQFLEQPIYLTECMRGEEEAARQNIQREIEILRGGTA